MRLLILEDNQERIKWFKQLFKNHDAIFCQTVVEAKKACNNFEFNIMLLDHDLDNKIWVNSSEENTGYQFIKWLVDNSLQKKSLFYIHSMNPVGANKMLNYLLDNGYDGIWHPFHLLKSGDE